MTLAITCHVISYRGNYFNFELTRRNDVNWVELGRCKIPDEHETYLGWEHQACSVRLDFIRCEANYDKAS